MYYCVDAKTGKRTSLQTSNEDEARQLVDTKNLAARQPAMNLQIAQVYLQHGDPALAGRTWQQVMEQMLIGKLPSNLARWQWAIRDQAFDQLRHRKLIETNADHFLAVLKAGTVATNVYLRRIHNYAVNMHWLPWPILPKPSWPKVRHREKRAITLEEHQKIIKRELNPATRAFYELLWHLGGAQSDIATLTAEDIDWKDGVDKDLAKSAEYFKKADEQFQAEANRIAEEKRLLSQDAAKQKFLRNLELADHHNNVESMLFCENCYRYGIGTEINSSKADEYHAKAVSLGIPEKSNTSQFDTPPRLEQTGQ